MKKIHIIEAIQSFLASDNAGDSKGMYHPEEIKIHLNTAFNQAVYNTWLNGKKFSDFSQLDAWSKTYQYPVIDQTGERAYAYLSFVPMQLPDNSGIRQVCDATNLSNVFAPIEMTASAIFSALDVNTMDNTPTYRLEQASVGVGVPRYMLFLEKLPVPPDPEIMIVNVLMIVPLDQIDDYNDIAMPSGAEKDLIQSVIELMSRKPMPDTSNDAVIERK